MFCRVSSAAVCVYSAALEGKGAARLESFNSSPGLEGASWLGPGKLFQLGTIYILFKIFQLDHLYSRAYSSISWNIWTPTAPWRAHGAPKIAQRCAKLRKIAPKQSENGRLLPHGVSYYVILIWFKCIKPFGSSKDREGLCL